MEQYKLIHYRLSFVDGSVLVFRVSHDIRLMFWSVVQSYENVAEMRFWEPGFKACDF